MDWGWRSAFEDSVFLAAHDSYLGTLPDLEGDVLLDGGADIAFRM